MIAMISMHPSIMSGDFRENIQNSTQINAQNDKILYICINNFNKTNFNSVLTVPTGLRAALPTACLRQVLQ